MSGNSGGKSHSEKATEIRISLILLFSLFVTVPPESICTSAAGFTRWTQGQCTRFALASTLRGTNEARDETETKPRESRVLQWPRLRALNCLCLLFVCVTLLVIRSHLPKRFSRKPQPPLAISSMHRSR